jgi:hypothetical protein
MEISIFTLILLWFQRLIIFTIINLINTYFKISYKFLYISFFLYFCFIYYYSGLFPNLHFSMDFVKSYYTFVAWMEELIKISIWILIFWVYKFLNKNSKNDKKDIMKFIFISFLFFIFSENLLYLYRMKEGALTSSITFIIRNTISSSVHLIWFIVLYFFYFKLKYIPVISSIIISILLIFFHSLFNIMVTTKFSMIWPLMFLIPIIVYLFMVIIYETELNI